MISGPKVCVREDMLKLIICAKANIIVFMQWYKNTILSSKNISNQRIYKLQNHTSSQKTSVGSSYFTI